MREWSFESDGAGAQKAVAAQIEGGWPGCAVSVTGSLWHGLPARTHTPYSYSLGCFGHPQSGDISVGMQPACRSTALRVCCR